MRWRNRKWILIIAAFLLMALYICRVVTVNREFPASEKAEYGLGGAIEYDGLQFTCTNVACVNAQTYEDMGGSVLPEGTKLILATFRLENVSGQPRAIQSGKDVIQISASCSMDYNFYNIMDIRKINHDFPEVLNAGESAEVVFPYSFWEDTPLEEKPVEFVFSLYPKRISVQVEPREIQYKS